MDILEFRDYCLSLPMSEECTPFDETTLVYKIGGKMYAYAGMENFTRFAVKCDPDRAVELRERYREITPAWHSSKRHWNDVYVTGDLPEAFLREQIRHPTCWSCNGTSSRNRCARRFCATSKSMSRPVEQPGQSLWHEACGVCEGKTKSNV